ncbi:MAG TPA: BamA/TamA family outer membrane protein [Longimicrobiales bacterium]
MLLPESAAAQYFGRQKVQYEDFDWRVLETERFDIHYYPSEREVVQDAARESQRWYSRLSLAFQHEFTKKPLIFYADHPDFQQTNVIGGMLSEGTGGVTEALKNRVIMPFTGVYEDNDHVLGHEMVHVFQYDIAAGGPAGTMGLNRLPLWLVEGMAEYLSLGRNDPHTAMWLRDAALRGELPTIKQLTTDTRFFPYRYGQALWAYIAGRWGDRSVTDVFRYATRSGFEAALQQVLGVSSEQLSEDWHGAIRETYIPLLEGRQRPEDAGDPILVDDEAGAMNLAPVVSPDGRYVAFFGRREIFTVDLYVADAQTGRVLKKLTSPNRNAHYDALSFIQSAGTWSPDGSKFAFVVFNEGNNELAILDIARADVERQIEIPGVGAIQNPAWSPDGRSIAFTGMAGGLSDLYILDLETNQSRQITNDRFADLEPAWSPDGRTIAIATDRAGTNLTSLTWGAMGLALVDVATGTIRPLSLFPEPVKHINPQYSPDGRSLYFIADRDGFSDVYRTELASGRIFQVTRVATGVSGITALAPAMSVASQSGRLMFSVFQNAGNNIYGLESARAQGELVPATSQAVARAAILPPVTAFGTGLVAQYLTDPTTGLPPVDVTFAEHDYSPSIKLDYLGSSGIGVGTSSMYGVGVGGGIMGYFSDMLGDHNLGVAIQANGSLKDIGGQAQYLNSERRLAYGATIGHIPYLSGFSSNENNGDGTATYSEILERIFIEQAEVGARYGFSTTRRFEVNAGFMRYSFDREQTDYVYDIATNQLVQDPVRNDLDSPDALNFFNTSAALVGDNSFFGFTSPVAGQRYRFEVAPTFGTLTYQTLLADYRRYFLIRPVTFAIRGLHYGRYGKNANGMNDQGVRVLSSPSLEYEDIIRGYARESFEPEECIASSSASTSACPVFDRLRGTKIAAASAELRIPLLGVTELGLVNFPYLPVEISPFFDAGYAWGSINPNTGPGGATDVEREIVMSTGLSARLNVLGYVIFEAYYAYPFQRPDKGAHFGFQLMPGW